LSIIKQLTKTKYKIEKKELRKMKNGKMFRTIKYLFIIV